MRHLTINQFAKLVPGRYLGADNATPAPFPGKWPTRIAWFFRGFDNGKVFSKSYIGKPTAATVSEFITMNSKYSRISVWFYEFDRKHIPIYHWNRVTGVWVHPVMFGVYHFWQSWGNMGEHCAVPTYRRQLGGLWIYTPYRALARERKESWRKFMLGNTTFKPTMLPYEATDSL